MYMEVHWALEGEYMGVHGRGYRRVCHRRHARVRRLWLLSPLRRTRALGALHRLFSLNATRLIKA